VQGGRESVVEPGRDDVRGGVLVEFPDRRQDLGGQRGGRLLVVGSWSSRWLLRFGPPFGGR
jgi:hypothetical protein